MRRLNLLYKNEMIKSKIPSETKTMVLDKVLRSEMS